MVGQDNIRGLVQDLSEKFDKMANTLREETQFAGTRPADAKTFMLISRHPRGLTALSESLGITRQATHRSVQRLVQAELVTFDYVEGSRRDMIGRLTPRGLKAQKIGLGIASRIEESVREQLGADDTERLRVMLRKLARGKPDGEQVENNPAK